MLAEILFAIWCFHIQVKRKNYSVQSHFHCRQLESLTIHAEDIEEGDAKLLVLGSVGKKIEETGFEGRLVRRGCVGILEHCEKLEDVTMYDCGEVEMAMELAGQLKVLILSS